MNTENSPRIVVFAYSLIGYACLEHMIHAGYHILALVTHEDNPTEHHWFPSVHNLATAHSIPIFTPKTPNTPEFIAKLQSLKPDIIFSFYYRQLICPEILDLAPLGAFNMHGSLLPQYRGCCPANWVIIHGEQESGATLHQMVKSADAGAIVAQQTFPITLTDHALDVTHKIKDAALKILETHLPALLLGKCSLTPQNISAGSYFGRRSRKDAFIDWQQSPWQIYNFVRSQQPYPAFPGGLTYHHTQTIRLLEIFMPENIAETLLPETFHPGEIFAISPENYLSIACHWDATKKRCLGWVKVKKFTATEDQPLSLISIGHIFRNIVS